MQRTIKTDAAESDAAEIPADAPIRLIWSPEAAAWDALSRRLGWLLALAALLVLATGGAYWASQSSSDLRIVLLVAVVVPLLLLAVKVLVGAAAFLPAGAVRVIFGAIGAAGARIAAGVALLLSPLWWPVEALFAALPPLARLAGLLGDKLVPPAPAVDQATLDRFPAARFPELYAAPPADLALPVVADGTLPGGVDTAWLARRGISRALLRRALGRAGLVAGLFGLILVLVPLWLLVIGPAMHNAEIAGQRAAFVRQNHRDATRYHALMKKAEADHKKAAALWTKAEGLPYGDAKTADQKAANAWQGRAHMLYLRALGTKPGAASLMPPAPASRPVGVGLVLVILLGGAGLALALFAGLVRRDVRHAIERGGSRYLIPTKDASTRRAYRADQHATLAATYRRQIEQATGRLADAPLFRLGTATGRLRLSGSLLTPSGGTPLCLDGESLGQHLLILGGTGEGKTAGFLRPLARQVLACTAPRYGAMVLDAKGTLWHDIAAAAETVGRAGDLVVIGTEPGQAAIDLMAALDPPALAYLVRDLFRQSGGTDGGSSSFFRDTAATVIRHAATIALAARGYDLATIYRIAVDQAAFEAAEALIDVADAPAGTADALDYFKRQWLPMVHETRDGVVATLGTILDPVVTDPAFAAFVKGEGAEIVDVAAALHGKIVVVALSATVGGPAAKLAIMAIKSGLFRAARLREARLGAAACQAAPSLVMVDEAQEIVTASPGGLSDAAFWNVARSAGLAGVYASQGVAALNVALGEEPARNLIGQFRSRVYLRSEDKETIEAITDLAGTHMRSHVYEPGHFESVEAWEAASGIRYLQPLETDQAAALAVQARTSGARLAALGLGSLSDRAPVSGVVYQPVALSMPYAPSLEAQQSQAMARAQWQYQETIRLQDRFRAWLHEGHDERPAVSGEEVAGWGRYHALVYVQRAGGVRFDVAEITHEFA